LKISIYGQVLLVVRCSELVMWHN